MIATPSVELLACTKLASNFYYNDEWVHYKLSQEGHPKTNSEALIEFAGRNCYASWNRPNKATRRNEDYLRRTVFEQGHGSIAEHATATFYLKGVSRAFLAELTRHRHLSFSVRSQRFVKEDNARFVVPPAIRAHSKLTRVFLENCEDQLEAYKKFVEELSEDDLSRKQVREAARALLPNATETQIVVTGNLRTWIEVINRRTQSDVDAEMCEVMEMVREKLEAEVSPTLFEQRD